MYLLLILAIILSGFSGLFVFTPHEVLAEYVPHAPFGIGGDANFAAQADDEGWPGNGTLENPYIIEGYEINASTSNGITISDTSVHFIIRDTHIINGLYSSYRQYDGIRLSSTSNGTIENCTFENNSIGIYLVHARHAKILDNTFISNSFHDIIMQGANNINISGNTMGKNGIYIDGDWLEDVNTHYIDTINTVNGKPLYYLKNKSSGLVPQDVGQVILANCTNIEVENIDIHNTSKAIQLVFSSNNNIVNNTIESGNEGIYLLRSTNNLITYNSISNNIVGIELEKECNWNNIENNHCQNNFVGISSFMSYGNTIAYNNASNNWEGIGIRWGSSDNIIEGNILYNNSKCGITLASAWGFQVTSAQNNIILNNSISHNEYGIRMFQYSSNNSFIGNKFINNDYGFYTKSCDKRAGPQCGCL